MSLDNSPLYTNIRLYPLYQIASSFLPWLPLFFLYFNQYVSLGDALVISSAYYFAVFLLEIPSGYLSDRYGRKPILITSSLCAVIAYATFLLADSFLSLVVAQCFLAGFFALKSGSDSSLLYDSLLQLDKQGEYADHEAEAAKLSMLSLAAAGLIGGLTGFYNLHIAYVLSLCGALASLWICFRFSEPEQTDQAQPFVKQLRVCFGYLRQPILFWIFGYFVLAYSLEHIPAEFNQPYVKLLQNNWFGESDTSALVSGVVLAVSMLTGAFSAAVSIRLEKLLGLRWLLIVSLSIQTVIIAAMALVLHPLVLVTVMFRNFSMALTHAPMLSAIAPLVASAQRATFLSIQSLAGRLGFSVALYSLASLTYVETGRIAEMSWPQLSLLLRVSLVFAVAALLVIYLTSRRLQFDTSNQ